LRKIFGWKYPLSIEKEGYPLRFSEFIPKYSSFSDYQFTFLNQSKSFKKNDIDWNYNYFGKLWTYNLNYFDFILQPQMNEEISLELIDDYISNLNNNSIGLEPYPIALRGINWIKFISHIHTLSSSHLPTISSSLYAQYKILLNNIEYHLLGNHLLEDAFSLLFGAFYFKDKQLYNKATEILSNQLEEQVLDDGAHFELSPMYHQIMLDRLLDCINLVHSNNIFNGQEKLLKLLRLTAEKMLSWLNNMTFSNGTIPLLNDSSPGIASTTKQLNKYASSLNLNLNLNLNLKNSGYRRYNGKNYECIIDIGQIGPSYQPGHAHADTFNFVLNVNNKPFIVDTGISTYESNETRIKERSTLAHNTVSIKNNNSSEIWSSFRVARRATVKLLKDINNCIIAEHNGFKKLSTIHRRKWNFTNNEVQISDTLDGKIKEGKFNLVFASNIKPIIKNDKVYFEKIIIEFQNSVKIEIIENEIPVGYNQFVKNNKIIVVFNEHLSTIFTTK